VSRASGARIDRGEEKITGPELQGWSELAEAASRSISSSVKGQRWLLVLALTPGCYRFAFEHGASHVSEPVATYVERRATYLNGLVGTGRIDTTRYCPSPVRTELRASLEDVVLSVLTLLVYTPRTLSVTCPLPTPNVDVDGRGAPRW
jgi:hypothetical protein